MKLRFGFIFFLTCVSPSLAQDEVYKEVTLEKYKIQNKIKNLILKSNEAQRNILFLEEEIKEMTEGMLKNRQEKVRVLSSIQRNLRNFSIDILKYKIKDFDLKSTLRLYAFKNWNNEFLRLSELDAELSKTNEQMQKSQIDMKKSLSKNSSLMFQLKNEMEELEVLQKYLRSDVEKSGPDSDFFQLIGKLKAPLANAKLKLSKGFYKVPGERVYDYNDGVIYSSERGEPIYPIASGILEGEIYVPNIGSMLIVKHTENIRSFYIGATSVPGLLVNDTVSPDLQFGLVKSTSLELKLRFDTETLDPLDWVKLRR